MQTTKERVETACRVTIGGEGENRDNEWVREPVTERLLTWYEPCTYDQCFPDGVIDVDVVVKKKRRRSTSPSLHRPRE